MSKVMSVVLAVLRFLGISLLAALALFALISLSCLFGTRCDNAAYSERMFWGGLIVAMGAMPAALAMLGSNQGYYSSPFTAGQDAKVALTIAKDARRSLDKRTMFALRAASVGIMCMGISALIDFLG